MVSDGAGFALAPRRPRKRPVRPTDQSIPARARVPELSPTTLRDVTPFVHPFPRANLTERGRAEVRPRSPGSKPARREPRRLPPGPPGAPAPRWAAAPPPTGATRQPPPLAGTPVR